MTDYRIYRLDRAGRIVTGCDVECPDDDAVRALAAQTLVAGAQAEIWDGTRCLGRVCAPLGVPAAVFQQAAAVAPAVAPALALGAQQNASPDPRLLA